MDRRCRIDRILIPPAYHDNITECLTSFLAASDHKPVFLECNRRGVITIGKQNAVPHPFYPARIQSKMFMKSLLHYLLMAMHFGQTPWIPFKRMHTSMSANKDPQVSQKASLSL